MAAIPRAIALDPTNPEGYVAGATDGGQWATEDGTTFHLLLSGLPSIMALTPLASSKCMNQR